MPIPRHNAPCHRAQLFEDSKQRNQIAQLSWSAQSQDISSTENVWQFRKNTIKNLQDLTIQLVYGIKYHYCTSQKLYLSMPHCLLKVKIQKGNITKYEPALSSKSW